MPSENVRTGIDTGSGGTAISHHGDVTKPADDKHTALSHEKDDQPIELSDQAQVAIYSGMGRTRTGIWYSKNGVHTSPEIWGDRTFASDDRVHPNAKPQDRGMNPAYTERQRRFSSVRGAADKNIRVLF